MTKAYFNDIFITDATYGIGMKEFAVAANSSYSILGSDTKPTLTFYKGTIPTAAAMNAFLYSSRTSDALLQFSNVANAFTRTNKRITFNYGNTVFGSILTAGTISWFCTGTLAGSGVAPYNAMPMLFGTVGLIGSGSDLELPKIDVNVGELWLCTDMNFDISNELTYS